MSANGRVPAYVLYLGPTGLTLVRALGRLGIPVVAVHHDIHEPCTRTRYARVKILPPIQEHEQAWLEFLLEEGRALSPRKGVLFAVSDVHWLFVAKHREKLEAYFHFSLPFGDDISSWMTKPFQYAAAERAGVPFPRTQVPRDLNDVEQAAGEMMFPCVLKPTLSHLWSEQYRRKLTFVHTRKQLIDGCQDAMSRGLHFMIQEFIPAEDHEIYGYYFYADRASQPLGFGVSKKIRQYEPRFGSSCCSVSVHQPEVEQLGMRLVKAMGFQGMGSVEFKRDPRDGIFKLMELNVRPPLMMGVIVDSGVNLPYLAYTDLCGEERPPAAVKPSRVRIGRRVGLFANDFHSARFYRQLGELSWMRWAWSWLSTRDIHFAWDDMRPMTGYLRTMIDHWRRGKYRQLPAHFPSLQSWRDTPTLTHTLLHVNSCDQQRLPVNVPAAGAPVS